MPQSNDTVADTKELTIEDMVDELNKEDEVIPKKENDKLDIKVDDEPDDVEKDDKKDDKTKKEEKEEELELKVDDEEDLDLVTPPRRAEILKIYPELFKKFPYIEKAMYREQQYTELLGTIEDAKELKERVDSFEKFESDLFKGDIGTVLNSLKSTDENAFAEVVDNLLPTLNKIDQPAYHHILGDVIKKTLISAVNATKSLDEETGAQLKTAASIIYQYVFGPGEFVPPQRFSKVEKKKDSETEKLNEERQQFQQERYESVRNELSTKVDNLLKNTISSNIDPKDAMSPYVKRTAVKDSLELLDRLIAQDARFAQLKDNLWKNAFDNNLSQSSIDKIRSAYLSKAKTLLPAIIKKIRAEALNSQSHSNKPGEERVKNKDSKLMLESSSTQRKNDEKGKIPRGMSTYDFLSSD